MGVEQHVVQGYNWGVQDLPWGGGEQHSVKQRDKGIQHGIGEYNMTRMDLQVGLG